MKEVPVSTSSRAPCTVRPSTEMLESGAEKGLLQCPAERQGGSYPKSPELPKGFWQSIFKSQLKELGVSGCAQFAYGGVAGCCHRY